MNGCFLYRYERQKAGNFRLTSSLISYASTYLDDIIYIDMRTLLYTATAVVSEII